METTQIKQLGISVADFELIVKALDHYTQKDFAGTIMTTLLAGIIGDNPAQKAEFERREKILEAKRETERQILTEDVRMVQSKIITLKRLMIENNLMESIK